MPAVYQVTGTADGLGSITPSATPGVDFNASTLRAAVIAANASPGADTINLPGGTYALTLTGTPEDIAASGDLDITDDLTIQHVGSGTTVIDATGLGDRVFQIVAGLSGGPTVLMNGLTIQGGQAPVNEPSLPGNDSYGGGILNQGSLTLTDCVVQNNQAQGATVNPRGFASGGDGFGGGIFTSGPTLSLIRTQILNNKALGGTANSQAGSSGFAIGGSGIGGGIATPRDFASPPFTGTITLSDSTVSDNLAQGGDASGDYGGDGGDGDGGGLSTQAGTVNINSSTIARNQAKGGTGIGGSPGGGFGGGINNLAALTMIDSTVSSNSATNDGGGIVESIPLDVTLYNDTITANIADSDGDGTGDGGGIWSDGTVTAASTIIAGNFDNSGNNGAVNPDVTFDSTFSTVTSLGNNLIGDLTGGFGFSAATHDLVGVPDPGLLPLGNYGGLTQTHALALTSPAIDQGSNLKNLSFDQRESPFLRTVGPQTDIGAYEVQYGSLSGLVYQDNNDNGVFEPVQGETGIAGVTMTLTGTTFQGNPVNLTTTTGATGAFSFGSLPPSNAAGYTLTEAQPGGVLSGKNTVGTVNGVTTGNLANPCTDTMTSIVVGDGGNGVNYNFGELLPGSLSGFVYQDNNDNGIFEPSLGETGISGVTVTLTGSNDQGTSINQAVQTGADGSYSFANLRPGVYTLTEAQPAGFTDGKATQGTPGNGTVNADQFANITLAAGVNGVNNNFGELLPPATAQLSGLVFSDNNNDGIFEPQLGETGIPNVSIFIVDVSGDPTVLTGADGTFVFTGLPAGTYVLSASPPAGFLPGTPIVGTAGGVISSVIPITVIVTLPAGTVASGYAFPETPQTNPPTFAAAVAVPGIVAPAVAPTLLGKIDLLGSGVVAGSTGSLGGYANYINGLYNDVLARAPSTADVNFWVSRMLVGETRQQVATEFWTSPEHRGLQVDGFYQLFLHRSVDSAGRAYWINVFLSGANENDVALAFLTSPEYVARAGGALPYVGNVYHDVLGRALDAAGQAYWVDGLQSGRFTFADVARGILYSPEAATDLAALYYARYLRRALDRAGAQYWVGVLESTHSPTLAAEELLASDEYYSLPH